MEQFVNGLPGVSAVRTATPRIIFKGGIVEEYLPGGKIINGTKSRDPDNVGDENVLRCGLVMGKITATGKYAPSILGRTNLAYTAGGTTLTVQARLVTELVRRIGSSGTFKIFGPPTAAGVVASETVTYSAASGTTVTITALANSYVVQSLIMPTDGSEVPLTFIHQPYGVNVFDPSGTQADQPFEQVPIRATVLTANIINYPADASLKAWLRGQMSGQGAAKFVFDDVF